MIELGAMRQKSQCKLAYLPALLSSVHKSMELSIFQVFADCGDPKALCD